jgi:hypothetical protein
VKEYEGNPAQPPHAGVKLKGDTGISNSNSFIYLEFLGSACLYL